MMRDRGGRQGSGAIDAAASGVPGCVDVGRVVDDDAWRRRRRRGGVLLLLTLVMVRGGYRRRRGRGWCGRTKHPKKKLAREKTQCGPRESSLSLSLFSPGGKKRPGELACLFFFAFLFSRESGAFVISPLLVFFSFGFFALTGPVGRWLLAAPSACFLGAESDDVDDAVLNSGQRGLEAG